MLEKQEPSSLETASNANNHEQDADTLAAFRAALEADESGESHDEGDAGESDENAEPNKGKPRGKPKTLKDAAERLGVADADLYAIEIPLGGDGQKITLGELKDLGVKASDLELRDVQLSERVSKAEAELTRARAELEELEKLAPAKPEDREKAKQIVATRLAKERKLIMDTIPEWSDSTVRESELGAMVEYLADFGLSEAFLTGNLNHKVVRMVRAATLQKQRIERALAKVQKVQKKPSNTSKSTSGSGAPRKPETGKASARPGDVRAQFAQTLRDAG